MNILLILGFLLAGGTLAADRWIRKLPQPLSIALYGAAAVLFMISMSVSRKAL